MQVGVDRKRLFILLTSFFFLSFSLFLRMMFVSVFPTDLKKKLLKLKEQQTEVKVAVAPSRKPLLDRKGRLLALEEQLPSFFTFGFKLKHPDRIQAFLELDSQGNWVHSEKKGFRWIKRLMRRRDCAIPQDLEDELFCVYEPTRAYPWGAVFESVLGQVGIDNQGLSGLEWLWDDQLLQPQREEFYRRNAKGALSVVPRVFYSQETERFPSLSFDAVLQKTLFDLIDEEAHRIQAQIGGALLIHRHTGELGVLVNWSEEPSHRLDPLVGLWEWGSVMKPLLVACALKKGAIQIGDEFEGGREAVFLDGRYVIHDTHVQEKWTLGEALQWSSNLVMIQILEKLSVESYWDCLEEAGFFGESPVKGALSASRKRPPVPQDDWRRLSVAFGQGMSSTLAHLMKAFLMLIQEKVPSHFTFFREASSSFEESSWSSPIQEFLRFGLRNVVKSGTARGLSSLPYDLYGKTSTAQLYDPVKGAYGGQLLGFLGVLGDWAVAIYFVKKVEQKGLYGGNTSVPLLRRWLEQVDSYPYWKLPLASEEGDQFVSLGWQEDKL